MKAFFTFLLILMTTVYHSQNCNGVTFNKDKFTGAIEVKTPLKHSVSFVKQIVDGDTAYYVYVAKISKELIFEDAIGVYILFDNGQKVQRPYAKIERTDGTTKFMYSIAFQLDSYDIGVFKNQKITDTRLAGIDNVITLKESKEMFDAFNCLMLK